MTLDEIWKLINTSEKTRKHCMQLENCVYDFFELTSLNMAQQGVFGEVLHVEGAYIHNLEDFCRITGTTGVWTTIRNIVVMYMQLMVWARLARYSIFTVAPYENSRSYGHQSCERSGIH